MKKLLICLVLFFVIFAFLLVEIQLAHATEPATMLLVGFGLIGLGAIGKMRTGRTGKRKSNLYNPVEAEPK